MEDNKSNGGFILGILLGAVFGTAAGILLAPHRGSKTRSQISQKAQDISDNVSDKAQDIKDEVTGRAQELVEQGLNAVNNFLDNASSLEKKVEKKSKGLTKGLRKRIR